MSNIISYFKNPALLELALIHKSYCNEHSGLESNERLEFLGDSVLSIVISDRLFRLFPHSPEGELTSRRSNLVQTITLSRKAKLLELDQMLKLSRGEEDTGGRTNVGLLANTFESVLGALFLDGGLIVCKKYLTDIFSDEEILADGDLKDPKSLLQERSQAAGFGTPIYKTLSAQGPDHAKLFEIEVMVNNKSAGCGHGHSKQKAQTEAAVAALAKLFPENSI